MISRVLSNNVAQLSMTTRLLRQAHRWPVRSNAFRVAAVATSALTCGMSTKCNPLGRSPSSEHLCSPPQAAGAGSLIGGKPRRSTPDGPAHRGVQRMAATRGQLPPGWHHATGCLPPLRVPGDLWGAVNVSWTAISAVLSPRKSTGFGHSTHGLSTKVRYAIAPCTTGKRRAGLQLLSSTWAEWHVSRLAHVQRRHPMAQHRRQTRHSGHPRRPTSCLRHCESGWITVPR